MIEKDPELFCSGSFSLSLVKGFASLGVHAKINQSDGGMLFEHHAAVNAKCIFPMQKKEEEEAFRKNFE